MSRSCAKPRPASNQSGWCVVRYDFIHDSCANGQCLKILTVTDEFTRESLAVEVATQLRTPGVIAVSEPPVGDRGAPMALRSAVGPEFVAQAVQRWLQVRQVQAAYITPGTPWQNAYGESFNGRLHDECLNAEWLHTVTDARVMIERWRRHYNEDRPYSSLGYQTPRAFRLAYKREQGSKPGWPKPI